MSTEPGDSPHTIGLCAAAPHCPAPLSAADELRSIILGPRDVGVDKDRSRFVVHAFDLWLRQVLREFQLPTVKWDAYLAALRRATPADVWDDKVREIAFLEEFKPREAILAAFDAGATYAMAILLSAGMLDPAMDRKRRIEAAGRTRRGKSQNRAEEVRAAYRDLLAETPDLKRGLAKRKLALKFKLSEKQISRYLKPLLGENGHD